MDGLIAYALSKKYTDEVGRSILDAGFKTQVEQDRSILQTTGQEKILYFIPKTTAKPSDGYDEYVYSNNAWEQVGATDVDLSSMIKSNSATGTVYGLDSLYPYMLNSLSTAYYNGVTPIASFINPKYNRISFLDFTPNDSGRTQLLFWQDANTNEIRAAFRFTTNNSIMYTVQFKELGVTVLSAVVNQNGTITFTNSDGTTFTTTGVSVIGKDGINVTGATVNQQGHLIITLSDGTAIDAGWIGMPQIDISNAVVTLSTSEFIYDGTSKAPSVTSVVLNGQTLTAGTDYAVIANPATNAGQHVVVVNGMGDYKGTVTTAWEIAKAQATISGDDSITITGIDDPVTKTYTTDGDGAFSFAITGNIATVANVGGEVTITPTALGSTTMTVTISEGANYLGATKTVPVEIINPVFGIVWDYSLSSPQLARLTPQTDSLGVVTTVPSQEPTACVGNDGNGQSDFDNYMPWAGMQRYNYVNGQLIDYVDYNNGETFVYIPDFWSKIVNDTEESKMYIYISSEELTGFTKHPGSGLYMSRYECNSDFLSAPGAAPKVNTSLDGFRTGITSIDNKHCQYDMHTYAALELLYIVEFAHLNTQSKIGAGITSGSTQALGQTDILQYHTGRVNGTNNVSAVQYRWIENLWGNVWKWVDGILIQDGLVYICNDRANYASSITNDYESTGLYTPITSNWHKTDQDYNDCYLIPLTIGSSDSTYTCDHYYYSSGLCCLSVGGRFNNGSIAGLFCWGGADAPGISGHSVGGRSILILGGDS